MANKTSPSLAIFMKAVKNCSMVKISSTVVAKLLSITVPFASDCTSDVFFSDSGRTAASNVGKAAGRKKDSQTGEQQAHKAGFVMDTEFLECFLEFCFTFSVLFIREGNIFGFFDEKFHVFYVMDTSIERPLF